MLKPNDKNLSIQEVAEKVIEEFNPLLLMDGAKLLGCGTFGCAYKLKGEDKVVKLGFYSDEEFKAANWIMENKIKVSFFPIIYKTLKIDLPHTYHNLQPTKKKFLTTCYAIWREPLNDVPYEDLDWIEDANTELEAEIQYGIKKFGQDLVIKDNLAVETANVLAESASPKDAAYLIQIGEIYHYCLKQYGIHFPDTMADAWGVRPKAPTKLVLRDLGAIRVP